MNERPPLLDRFGRRHNNLRISVTDRCNLRCTYCMSEDVVFKPRDALLSFEEIVRFTRIAAGLGINKLRLTGGEPLLRAELPKLIGMLSRFDGITDIALTTNGVLLDRQGQALYDAGLRRLNISLDSLDADSFAAITRRDMLSEVLRGIESARDIGFDPIKINAVALTSMAQTDPETSEIVRLARFCRERGLQLRFIEFMPLEADRTWEQADVLSAESILSILESAGLRAVPAERSDPSAPASEYVYADGQGSLGIVASVTQPFCGSCNRLRISADGQLRNCLFALDHVDIKHPLRSGASDDDIADLIRRSVAAKWEGHQINSADYTRPEMTMHQIGG